VLCLLFCIDEFVSIIYTSFGFRGLITELPVYTGLDECLKMNEVIHPQEFEVKGTSRFPNSEAPKRGRMNADKQVIISQLNFLPVILSGLALR
jgi:hypothetical protein